MATQEEIDAYDDELILRPKKPIEFGGKTYHELTLREPTAKQLAEISRKVGVDATIHAITVTASVLPGVADQLKARDLVKAQEFFDRFLETAAAADRSTETSD